MADREPRSVNFDVDNLEWMDDNIGNRSEFINELIQRYREGTSEMNEAVARFRLEQLQSQKASLKTRVDSIESEIESVRSNIHDAEKLSEAELSEAREALESTPKDPSNPAIKAWASDLGMTAVELVEELTDGDGDE